MSITNEVKAGEALWYVSSGFGLGCSEPCVIVPISQCMGMTVSEIGAHVKELVLEAHRVGIIEEAEYLSTQKNLSIEEIESFLVRAAGTAETDLSVKSTCEMLQQIRSGLIVRKQRQERTKSLRQEMRFKYDFLFVAVGRRDGFKCAACGSVDNLTLDHKIALANGGTNEIENLQILCRSCNSKKSDSE